jgi:hypothetical protein
MNEKAFFICGIILGFAIAAFCAGFATYKLYGGRSPKEVAALDIRLHQLNRDYSKRQRELENNLEQCIEHVENAGNIVERTSANTGRAIQNLREAVLLIEQGIEERKSLEMELNSLRAGLHRIRDSHQQNIEQMTTGE